MKERAGGFVEGFGGSEEESDEEDDAEDPRGRFRGRFGGGITVGEIAESRF